MPNSNPANRGRAIAWQTSARSSTDSGPLTTKLLKNGTLKTYGGFPHGMPTTQAETINADLLAFLRVSQAPAAPPR